MVTIVLEAAEEAAASGHFDHIRWHFHRHCLVPTQQHLHPKELADDWTMTPLPILLPTTTTISCWTCCCSGGPGCMCARYRRLWHHSQLEWDFRCHSPATDSAAAYWAMLAFPSAEKQTRIAPSVFLDCWTLGIPTRMYVFCVRCVISRILANAEPQTTE